MTQSKSVSLGAVAEVTRGVSYNGQGLGKPGPLLVGMGNISFGGEIDFTKARTYGGRVKDEHFLTQTDVAVVMTDLTHDGKLLGLFQVVILAHLLLIFQICQIRLQLQVYSKHLMTKLPQIFGSVDCWRQKPELRLNQNLMLHPWRVDSNC